MNGIGRNGNADVSGRPYLFGPSILSLLSLLIFSLCLASVSCTSKPTDMRTLVPADSLVYLETNDLGAALQPIVDSKPFGEAAKSKPDLSALKGVQLAVAITGFETSEEKLTDEHSVGRIQPHFVAVAETHAWQFQAVGFAEQKLGAFVAEMYDGEPKLERSEKRDGRFFTWTAADGRKAFALVKGSLIYFGNDETAIDKCLAVKFDGADSIAKAGKVAASAPETLASGYVGPDGIAQIASLIGLKFASEAGEESEVQSALAGIIPKLIRGSVTDVSWKMSKTEQGIEDKYSIAMPPDIANVFNETMATSARINSVEGRLGTRPFAKIFGDSPSSATVYNFKDPRIAWRGLMAVVGKQLDVSGSKIIGQTALAMLEPYGIRDPESFLGSASSVVVTMTCGEGEEDPLVAMYYSNISEVKSSLSPGLAFQKGWPGMVGRTPDGAPMPYESILLATKDNDIGAFFDSRMIVVGSLNCVVPVAERIGPPTDVLGPDGLPEPFSKTDAPIASVGKDRETAVPVVELLSELKPDVKATGWSYFTETRFTKTGIERKTTSGLGLIGSIIAQLNDN